MPDDELLSGTDLLDRLGEFFRGNKNLLKQIKISVSASERVRVVVMRCQAIEALAGFLADRVKVAVLAHQHDIVLAIGNVALLGGETSWLKRHDARGREIDITTWKDTIEVKNGVDITARDLPMLVNEYFDEMLSSKASKRTWWLCFLLRRPEPKGKIGEVCMYYLAIVEIAVAGLTGDDACRVSLGGEAMHVAEELEKRIVTEDAVEEGFLVPVKNVWIVDKLRMESKQKDKALAEKDKALAEKVKALAEKDKETQRLARENAELKKRFQARK
jgi:hypothetical protein